MFFQLFQYNQHGKKGNYLSVLNEHHKTIEQIIDNNAIMTAKTRIQEQFNPTISKKSDARSTHARAMKDSAIASKID